MEAQFFHLRSRYGKTEMSTQTILLVDDDETLLELLSDHIQMAGYRCVLASSGAQGLQLAAEEKPQLVVLDVMMPGIDGWEVCKHLREMSSAPVIMLTAKGEEFDKLRGFRLGVDDYVTKPFSFAEIVARIGAVLARTSHKADIDQRVTSGDLVIDFDQRHVWVGDKSIELTPTEYRLLATLVRNLNSPVSTDRLLDEAWGPEYSGQVEQVKHYIWSLRQKIEQDPGDPRHIITERGFGYRFE